MRRTDWPERMNDALDRARGATFSEEFHCANFAADVVLAMTDVDPLPVRHSTIAAAYAHMRSEGYETVEDALSDKVGPSVMLSFARRGDVILGRSDDGTPAIGICCGEETAFISSSGGLVFEPTLQQVAAYRVL